MDLRAPRAKQLAFLGAALLFLGVTGAVVLGRASDEDQIRAQLTRLAKALHVGAGSNPMLRVPRVRSEFAAIFDDPLHASVPELPMALPTDRAGLADKTTEVSAAVPELDVSFRDIEIKLGDTKTVAQVETTVKLTTPTDGLSRPVSFLLYKKDGMWRITSVTVWAGSRD